MLFVKDKLYICNTQKCHPKKLKMRKFGNILQCKLIKIKIDYIYKIIRKYNEKFPCLKVTKGINLLGISFIKITKKKKRYDGNLKITSEESMTMYTHTHTSKHRRYLPIIGKEDTTIKLSVFTNYKFNMIVTKKSLLDLF